MFSWVKNTAQSTLATVAGTAEPVYGAEALHSVALQEDQNPTYEITPDDHNWLALPYTSAETQTFYLEADSGYYAIVQTIYSNVANIHFTAQFNVKVFYPDHKLFWSSKALTNYAFDEEKKSMYADDYATTLSEDNDTYVVKSAVDPDALVDLKIHRSAPGFKIGKDARTNYGNDPENPWGCIRHMFWPTATVEGVIVIEKTKLDFTGRGMYVSALQGMKPHHAAARWNFVNVQGKNFSAVMMEFTTPPSYGSVTVNVGGIIKDGALLTASAKGTAEHTAFKQDEVADWPEPTSVKYVWHGKTKEGKDVEATVEGELGERVDRVDFMAEVPGFVKSIVSVAAGTRPYIYQYWKTMPMKLQVEGEEVVEEVTVFAEATFIS